MTIPYMLYFGHSRKIYTLTVQAVREFFLRAKADEHQPTALLNGHGACAQRASVIRHTTTVCGILQAASLLMSKHFLSCS